MRSSRSAIAHTLPDGRMPAAAANPSGSNGASAPGITPSSNTMRPSVPGPTSSRVTPVMHGPGGDVGLGFRSPDPMPFTIRNAS